MFLAKLLFASTVLAEDCHLCYNVVNDVAYIEDYSVDCPNRTRMKKDEIMNDVVADSCFDASAFVTEYCLWT